MQFLLGVFGGGVRLLRFAFDLIVHAICFRVRIAGNKPKLLLHHALNLFRLTSYVFLIHWWNLQQLEPDPAKLLQMLRLCQASLGQRFERGCGYAADRLTALMFRGLREESAGHAAPESAYRGT
jgi:hypothetical protein